MRMIIVAVGLFVCAPSLGQTHSALAATWYVAANGNDGNACTSADAPCLTFAGVQNKAIGCGDIVQFAAGDYSVGVPLERHDVRRSGCPGAPIVYRGHDGSGCRTTSAPTTRAGLTVGTDLHHPTGHRPIPTVRTQRWVVIADYVTIDCFQIAHTVSYNDAFYLSGPNRRGISIINNAVNGDVFECRHGVYHDNSPRTEMPSDIYVARNYFRKCTIGISAGFHNSLVEQNEIDDLGGGTRDYMRAGGDGITMRLNYAYGANLDGCPGCHIDCVQQFILNSTGDHVLTNFRFDRNTCLNVHQGIITQDESSGSRAYTGRIQNLLITNNVIANGVDSRDPLAPGAWCLAIGSARDVKVYNNTCYNFLNGIGFGDGTTGTVKNNIVVATINPISLGKDSSAVSAKNLFFNEKLTYRAETWPNEVLNVNPLFREISREDFRLRPGSPAAGAGELGLGVSVDRNSVERGSASVDIGAYRLSAPLTQPKNLKVVPRP